MARAEFGIIIPKPYMPYFQLRWIAAITRILLIARSFGHGGTFIILPDQHATCVNIKYKLSYDRLAKHLPQLVEAVIGRDRLENWLHKNEMKKTVSLRWHRYIVADATLLNLQDAISSSIKTIAAMSRVDGAVVLDSSLCVRGFGGVITSSAEPKQLDFANDELATGDSLRHGNAREFGTRHQSVFRLCGSRPGVLGLVVSQDGDVRAIQAASHETVVVWDNIQLHQQM